MTNIKAILNMEEEQIIIDGQPKKEVDFNREDIEVVFKFSEKSTIFKKLKGSVTGGSIVPRFNMSLNDINYDVYAFGAKNELPQEISFYLVKA